MAMSRAVAFILACQLATLVFAAPAYAQCTSDPSRWIPTDFNGTYNVGPDVCVVAVGRELSAMLPEGFDLAPYDVTMTLEGVRQRIVLDAGEERDGVPNVVITAPANIRSAPRSLPVMVGDRECLGSVTVGGPVLSCDLGRVRIEIADPADPFASPETAFNRRRFEPQDALRFEPLMLRFPLDRIAGGETE